MTPTDLEQIKQIAELTPKDKAEELYNKMYDYSLFEEEAKRCALIAVDEILNIKSVDKDYDLSNYWEEVKQELEKL